MHFSQNGLHSFHLVDQWATPCYEKLSSLNWQGGFTFQSAGVRIGIRVNDPSICEDLFEKLPVGAAPCPDSPLDCVFSFFRGEQSNARRVRNYHLLYCNHSLVARSLEFDDLFDPFTGCLALTVASLSKERVFIHAGAVAWKGRAIILPGPSMAGKSTLVAALIRAGADYLSDEFAVIDAEGLVHPYPKPISLRMGDGAKQTNHPVETFGGKSIDHDLPLGLILMCNFASDSLWNPVALTPGRALLALLANTPASRLSPHHVVPVLERLSVQSAAFSSSRGEADEIAGTILQMSENEGVIHAGEECLEHTRGRVRARPPHGERRTADRSATAV